MSLNSFSGINISKFFRKQRYKYFTKWVVAGAMLEVDRNDFAPTNPYQDSPQSINYNVNISAPHMHALALEYLM